MRKLGYIFLSILLIATSFCACNNKEPSPTTGFVDPLSLIMESPNKQPQLSKEEFIEITNNYLSTSQWALPSEKACFYTYGVNHSAYIIDDEYLFSLNAKVHIDGSLEYDFYLSYFIDGVVVESETDPLLFEKFIK